VLKEGVVIVGWFAQRIEILMVAGIVLSSILFVLAIFAGDGLRIMAYPVVIIVLLGIRRGARLIRIGGSGRDTATLDGERITSQRPVASLADGPHPLNETARVPQLLDLLASQGFELWLEGDELVVEGERAIEAELAASIRANKPYLVNILRDR
jgi:hypothetical protein